jgi:PAS domain S-box-containing protein
LGDKKVVQAIVRDITECKKAEEALKESEKNYRSTINSMNDMGWVVDFDGNFIDVNDATVSALGYPRENLLSMGILDIDHALASEQISGIVDFVKNNKKLVFETEHTTKDGKKIPVEISVSLVVYKGKQVILGIARSISEKRRHKKH